MLRMAFLPAALTGVFCAGFAAVIDLVTEAMNMLVVIVLAFLFGFHSRVFASFVYQGRNQAGRGA